ncbi:FKBP-type peptidyl-prolyl cis-trans isomerase FkpA/FKBP-type peptidyl-prolyl cis-trans isomerase FklB [Parapedobacter indicus]|uniref:Peptidyl-prolyl cis-trans isomerase n=2 Tax=Parapedobacter indicus TaxID=1477437 RepID=A0A1I3SNT0_9SPHI|nr:FKBP-type peptidyl-prolyl cis-trans isomerase FkpA/FKBP-type peptidyl-prolyl cis-trans isomerase FklB [Parapedobacter indicus]SFJ59057.1 FKBP-type peptidyl-prolyl cis-trans isomerase FkpA/FKBP-type peptidyl-prolyl cis-trans isomerase FklB [Parapedobacter indicus]
MKPALSAPDAKGDESAGSMSSLRVNYFRMKFLSIAAAGCLAVSTGSLYAQQPNAVNLLKSRSDSVAYAFGASIARDLKRTGMEEINATVLAQAVTDVFAGKETTFNETAERELIMEAITAAREKMDAQLKQEAVAFMESNKAKPGITTTESGLQYEIIRDGTGEKPTLTDTVTVHYKGQLSDGNVFDSSYDRGEPATFTLDRVIKGWQEGIQLMPQGAQYRIYIPYDLGYGERGAGQDIPPYSSLIFDVELISVKKRAEEAPSITDPVEAQAK